ncbi:polysaccharide pyruvyl transferase family protein [Marivirga sp.]|uniref:polysaccharide pyruvyl transferase family protein n=1 Tax=Marivirga sp. TaxID=2018662 RepID=UPI003DA758A9
MSNCIICRSRNIKIFEHITRDDFPLSFKKCADCNHIEQIPRKDTDIYSSGEFSEKFRDSTSPSASKIKELDKRALKRFDFYNDFLPKKMGFALEIGSSIGSFLHILKLHGANVEGVEPDKTFADFSQNQYGFRQNAVMLEDYQATQKFDFICSFHVIEHVPNPHDFLSRLKDLAKEGATILHEFPSMEIFSWGDLKNTYWEPHLQYFNAASVYYLFSQYFKIEKIGYYGAALYVVAKNEKPEFNKTVFNKYKRKAALVKNLIKVTPSLKIKKKIDLKEFGFRLFTEKNDYIQKAAYFGKYALKEFNYVRKEKNKGGKKLFQHLTYFRGWENAGDTVLSKTVRDTFNQRNSIQWQLNKVTEDVTSKTIAHYNKSEHIIIGGGGLFLPDTNKNDKSGWQWPISADLLEQITSPISLFAVGYNYFPGQTPNEFFISNLNAIVRKAKFVGLRNSGSIKAVKNLIDKNLRDKIVFQPCTTTVIRQLNPKLPAKLKSKNISINMAFDRYEKRFGSNIYEILDQVALALKKLEKMGYRIQLTGHLQEDNKFRILLDKHNVSYQTHVLQFMTPNEVYQFYNEMEIVIGMRGHAQMIPFGLNCKIITLSTHNKMKFFMDDLGTPELSVDLKVNFSSIKDRILKSVDLLINEDEFYKDIFYQKQLNFYSITQTNLREILED